MSLTVKANSNSDYVPPPAGNHLARCYRVIDLGTQKVVWKGTEKAQKRIMLVWELHGEDADGQPLLTDDGRPLVVSRKFTPSLSNKATLRAFLQAWRGREFTDDELAGFNLKNILDKWCMVNITHTTNGDRTYANVSNISAVPSVIRKAGLPEGVNPTVWFDIDEPDMEVFNSFPDYLKEQIEGSPEWRMRSGNAATQTSGGNASDEFDEDAPF